MRGSLAAIEAFLLHPFVALAVAVVFLVISWRLGGDTSNAFLIFAWALLALAVFRTIHPQVALSLRFLWTMLSASVIGLVLYPLRYESPKIMQLPAVVTAAATTPTAAEIASEVVKQLPQAEPRDDSDAVVVTAKDKANRRELRKQLTQFLIRGELLRTNIRGLTHRVYDDQGRLIDDSKHMMKQLMESQEWEVEMVRFVFANFGEDRSTWFAARVQVTDYPDTSVFKDVGYGTAIGDVVRDRWEVVISRMVKLEQLLREYPEL